MSEKPYSIQERSFAFAVELIQFVRLIPPDLVSHVVAKQVIRSGTSIGANTEEADAAESRADFVHKMGIALKEARETRYWLRLLDVTYPEFHINLDSLIDESEQLIRIIAVIIRKGKIQPGK